jgi:RNA polymerase sigma-70 factor (ECF subfamily)
LTDAELIRDLRARETEALRSLVRTFAAAVHGVLYRVLAGFGTEQDIEECVSDVFHKAWHQIDEYDANRAPFKTWLLILAKYEGLKRRRSLHRGPESESELLLLTDPGPTPEQQVATAEERTEVQQALQRLSPLDQELVYRRYFAGERVDVLARDLGITRQAADNHLWRARKRLRQILSQQGKGVPVVDG